MLNTEIKGASLGPSAYFAIASYGKVFVFKRNRFVLGQLESIDELRKSGFGMKYMDLVSSANTAVEVTQMLTLISIVLIYSPFAIAKSRSWSGRNIVSSRYFAWISWNSNFQVFRAGI